MTSGNPAHMRYVCTNDLCRRLGEVQYVPSGKPADCDNCGWSLTSAEGVTA